MGGYVVNFTVYTMAMIGLICFAVFVYKKIMTGGLGNKHTNFIEIEDTLNLNPRKTLHVIRAGNEKFLIASDVDRTSLISKLNDNKNRTMENLSYPQESRESFNNVMDYVQQNQQLKKVSQPKQTIHLEPITKKMDRGVGISNLRKSLDSRAGEFDFAEQVRPQQTTQIPRQQSQRKSIQQNSISRQQQQKASGSALREMAKKINEL